MRIARAFLALPLLGLSGVWSAESSSDRALLAHIAGPPAMKLPGMSPPAVAASAGPTTLPMPLISDVTNAPNPFDSRKPGLEGQTRISYSLIRDLPVRVTLYDLLGHRVRRWEFVAGKEGGQAGENHVWWDGTNESGQKVSKGGYLAQIEIEASETIVTVIRKIGVIH